MHVFSSDILLLTHSSINNTRLANDPTSHLNKYCKSNRIILTHLCPPTQDRWTPTYVTAFNGHTEVLKSLIGAKADVNAADFSLTASVYVNYE